MVSQITNDDTQQRTLEPTSGAGTLDRVKAILEKKAADYGGQDGNKLWNFEFAGTLIAAAMEQGAGSDDLAYLSLIAVKLGRLMTLLGGDRAPRNESIRDTFDDLVGYVALWSEQYERTRS